MTGKITFVCSGQGSQHFEMARSLFDRDPVFSRSMVQLDGQVRELCGTSVLAALYGSRHRAGDPFERTLLTHPAIFMVEYSLARSLIGAGLVPHAVVGASLGSFAAAALAGVIAVEDALSAVVRQAVLFEEHCQRGAMVAVLADVERHWTASLQERCELAAINFSSHFVLSLQAQDRPGIEARLREAGASHQWLPVSHAFHSRWIDEACTPFEAVMRAVRLHRPQLPMVCCERAAGLTQIGPEYFWNVVRRPIRLRQTIDHLERDGPREYVDVGPAGTFATLLKYGLPPTSRSSVHAILSPYGHDERRFGEVCARLCAGNQGAA